MTHNLWPIALEDRRGRIGGGGYEGEECGGVIYNGNSCCELMLVSDGFESCFERAHFFPFLLL